MAKKEDVQDTDKETMADIVDKTRPVYTGHPAEGGSDDSSDADDTDSQDSAEDDSDDGTSADDDGSPDDDKSSDSDGELTFKYSSHEEAEKGYKEAERLAHERAEEAKRERLRAEELQAKISELESRTAEDSDSKSKEEPTENVMQARMRKLYSDIARIDPEDPECDNKAADLWAELSLEQQRYVDEQLDAFKTKLSEEYDAKMAEKETEDLIVSKAIDDATKFGLDMKDGSPESKLFWTLCKDAPDGGSIDDQIQWTCKEVKSFISTINEPVIKDKEKAKQTQENNAVLDRGGSRSDVSTKTDKEDAMASGPMSLGELFQRSERRI